MNHAERMKEIEAREFSSAWHIVWKNEVSYREFECEHGFGPPPTSCPNSVCETRDTYNAMHVLHYLEEDIPFLLARVKELEAALGEAMLTMRDDADVFNRLTAIKEGRHE